MHTTEGMLGIAKSAEILKDLASAEVFAFMPDGTIWRLEEIRVRPPVVVREVDPDKFREWFAKR